MIGGRFANLIIVPPQVAIVNGNSRQAVARGEQLLSP